ncbi:MAG: WYL domain-containing protein [Chloroflexota bacterium]
MLSLLLLLQTRGRMSARALAAELDVTERTIYRDVEALSAAGVPIYAETGVKGGYALLDSYRTSLTGMNEAEVRALFMLSIPEPLADLGVSQELRSALLKLTAALPARQRQDESHVRQRIHLDAAWWFQGGESILHLPVVQQAVWQDRKLRIHYATPFGPAVGVTQVVEPYGLVAKAGVWYVVYARNGRFLAKRISKLLEAVVLDETFSRDPGFELTSFWQTWCKAFETRRAQYPVTVRVAPQFIEQLPHYFGETAPETAVEAVADDGWAVLTLTFESLEEARTKLLGLGGAVEVLSPLPLRLSIADFAAQIGALYRE